MIRAGDLQQSGLDGRMTRKIGAGKFAVPWPFILGIRSGVDTGETASVANELFKGGLLIRIENVTGRVEKYDNTVSRQISLAECRRVFRGVDIETRLGSERPDSRDPGRNRVVAETARLCENKNAKSL
jgi:hypothetical protein